MSVDTQGTRQLSKVHYTGIRVTVERTVGLDISEVEALPLVRPDTVILHGCGISRDLHGLIP
jgi:hypothetical protein